MKVIIRYGIFGCGGFCWRLQILIRKKSWRCFGLFKKWNNNKKKICQPPDIIFCSASSSIGFCRDHWARCIAFGYVYRIDLHPQSTPNDHSRFQKKEKTLFPELFYFVPRVCRFRWIRFLIPRSERAGATVVRHLWQVRTYDETPFVELLDAGEKSNEGSAAARTSRLKVFVRFHAGCWLPFEFWVLVLLFSELP